MRLIRVHEVKKICEQILRNFALSRAVATALLALQPAHRARHERLVEGFKVLKLGLELFKLSFEFLVLLPLLAILLEGLRLLLVNLGEGHFEVRTGARADEG